MGNNFGDLIRSQYNNANVNITPAVAAPARLGMIHKLLSNHRFRDLLRVQVVEALFERIMGRAATDEEQAAALRFVADHGGNFRELTRHVLDSVGAGKVSARDALVVLVEAYYQGFLKRPADAKRLDAHVFALEHGRGDQGDLAVLAASSEFFERFSG